MKPAFKLNNETNQNLCKPKYLPVNKWTVTVNRSLCILNIVVSYYEHISQQMFDYGTYVPPS